MERLVGVAAGIRSGHQGVRPQRVQHRHDGVTMCSSLGESANAVEYPFGVLWSWLVWDF